MCLEVGVRIVLSFVVSILFLTAMAAAQPLPLGKWLLEEYRFDAKTEVAVKGIKTTLVVRAKNRLGGDSGCNAYGGSYSTVDGKLKIADIISTMRACQEPSPSFEKSFFDVLENADSAKVEGHALVIFDGDSHYLKFVRDDREKN
jgi:heat shock protein HslJ